MSGKLRSPLFGFAKEKFVPTFDQSFNLSRKCLDFRIIECVEQSALGIEVFLMVDPKDLDVFRRGIRRSRLSIGQTTN